jgi:hypothetical protein
MTTTHVLPFGKHKGVPLCQVPTSYLQWLAGTVRLSSGLSAAVRAELEWRNVPAPAPRPAGRSRAAARRTRRDTRRSRAHWLCQRDGRKAIRGECAVCGRWVGTLPDTPENRALADAGTDRTALLTLLMSCEDLGITVRRVNGNLVFDPPGKMTPVLWRLERQCRGTLRSCLSEEASRW